MFGVKLAEKRTNEEKIRVHSARKESQWLRKYNSEVKPRLLERYDSRVGAFLRQAEEAPADPSRVSHHVQSSKLRPFRFRDTGTPRAQEEGVLRSSAYAPLSSYQFRDRNKEKELPPKIEQRVLRLRRWQKELHQAAARRREDCLSKPSGENLRALYQDNRSDIPSLDDNQSLRFSMNENIELEARLYEKEQQLVEKKKHFKRLTNLELLLADHKAKRAIHELLVKNGLARPRIKTEAEEEELDLLRIEIEKEGRK